MTSLPARAGHTGLLIGCALALAACGSKPGVDKGGFTSSQRAAAQAALDLLPKTTIPRTVLNLSFQTGQVPNICSILLHESSTDMFDLFLAWDPTRPAYRSMPHSVLQAAISVSSAKEDTFHVTSFGGQLGKPESPATKASLARVALTRPAEQCQVLNDGRLQIVTPR